MRNRLVVPAGFVAAIGLALSACSREPEPTSSPERHALAERPPGGSSPADEQIRSLQARLRREPRSPEAWLDLGEAWVVKARRDADPALHRSAEDAALAAQALAPLSPRAVRLRGLALLEDHRFDEARGLLAALLERDPHDATALGLLSDALLDLGRFDEAALAAQRMIELKPNLPAYARAAHLLWLQGDVEAALGTYRLAADAGGDPEARAWVSTQAALVEWHRGRLDAADGLLDRALLDAPDHPAALVARGRVALSRGDSGLALAALERAFLRLPLPETAWLLGDARELAGDEEGAREARERVLRGGRAFDRRTLALFLATKDRDAAEAVRLCEEARRERDDLYTEDTCAWALYRAGRLAEAEAASRKALALGTPDARLLHHAGAIRLARGDRSGLALVRRALRLNPGFDRTGAAEARRLLGEPAGTSSAVAPAARSVALSR
jgi:tetratricopeptide (TPR) repeat protein